MQKLLAPLPIDAVLDDLKRALRDHSAAVLVAPPGAGKTTRVPLALVGEPWLGNNRVLILEPRRLAARNAAARMAATLAESVGQTVGIRARMSTKVGSKTQIEVITEGVFTRLILDDPSLEGVGAVLFDEFHERSLDADLGLALALETQRDLRNDLRLLVMSATLEGARIAGLIGNAPLVESEGRAFPVTTEFLGRNPGTRIEDQMTDAIAKALRSEHGSILAFLPGQGEIRRVEQRLKERVNDPSVIIAPLYGSLDRGEQDRAIEPPPRGQRKVVLATSIAETSLTIEGVRIVVDCGLSRIPRYEPDVGITRLVTVRASRASADQRRGRAGRTEAGVCYRLWDEAETASLPAFAEPEIRSADLAPLTLDCAEWGVTNPATLQWLDAPPKTALEAAREELQALQALDDQGHITSIGRKIRALPLPPRLANMVIRAASLGQAIEAAEIAALLVERGLGGNDVSLEHRLESFHRDRTKRATEMRRLAEGWARTAEVAAAPRTPTPELSTGILLALAYPDRIARTRGATGQFILANGRGAYLDPTDHLARERFLVVAELQGTAAATRILSAARATEAEISAAVPDRIREYDELAFDRDAAAIRARRVRRLDAIELASDPRPVAPSPAVATALANGIAALGITRLPWTKAQLQLRDRVGFLRDAQGTEWPDLSDHALTNQLSQWLEPFLSAKTRLSEITADDLGQALETLLPWSLKRRLEEDAPTHFEAPTGNRYTIDYETAGAPALHIRVQELFGVKAHPSIAAGKLPLTLHLLSPAMRPIQITRDLPGFWAGSWSEVKAEMKGRYPRHVWPDDPASAIPTARAKPRGT